MALKKYTQAEFDALPANEHGGKICPAGDYTEIQSIPAFSELGNGCKLGRDCTLGNSCTLGDYCKLGDYCQLGDFCMLGNWVTMGDWVTLGEWVTLGKNISFESGRVKNGVYLTCGNIGSENRTAYFYADETGRFFVRAGCWFSDMDEFITRVKSVHGGTVYETQYLAACEYAKAILPATLEKERTH